MPKNKPAKPAKNKPAKPAKNKPAKHNEYPAPVKHGKGYKGTTQGWERGQDIECAPDESNTEDSQ